MKLSKVYRLPDGLYRFDGIGDLDDSTGEDQDIYLEKVEFMPLEMFDYKNRIWILHKWKFEIKYLEDYRRLIDFGYPNDLSSVPCYLASDYS